MIPRVAVLVTHPIQYFAPLFRLLASRGNVDLRVFYGWEGAVHGAFDHGFGRAIQWDIPLLDGYEYTFLPNDSNNPGTHHFFGIRSRQLVSTVQAWRPDALLVFGWNCASHLNALRTFHGTVPIFFRGDSTLLDERPSPRQLARRAWLSWVYRHVDVALYVGQHNRAYFEAHGIRGARLVWAPHSIDNDRFSGPSEDYATEAAEWRRSLGIGPNENTVLYAGKLEPVKAPEVLLEAFSRLRDQRPREHLLVVGTGPLEAQLRARAAENSNVHFLGFQNQTRMPIVYRLADLFVLPSRRETWGLAINEAMACGRAVVVSDRVGCAPDLVESPHAGLVFPSEDAAALAAALRRLFDDVPLRRRMGEIAQKTIQSWSLEEQTARIEAAVTNHRFVRHSAIDRDE